MYFGILSTSDVSCFKKLETNVPCLKYQRFSMHVPLVALVNPSLKTDLDQKLIFCDFSLKQRKIFRQTKLCHINAQPRDSWYIEREFFLPCWWIAHRQINANKERRKKESPCTSRCCVSLRMRFIVWKIEIFHIFRLHSFRLFFFVGTFIIIACNKRKRERRDDEKFVVKCGMLLVKWCLGGKFTVIEKEFFV